MTATDLHTMLADNARASVTPVTRRILDNLDERARTLLRAIREDERDAKAGFDTRLSILSLHGGEDAARDIIRQSAWHREHGKVRAAA